MKDFFKSFDYAFKGILSGFRSERNLKIQLSISASTIGAAYYFSVTSGEWCIILLCIGMVLAAELFNTAIEKLVDLVTQEKTPLAGKIKDMAAGSVLIISTIAVIIGIIIFGKYVLKLV